MAGHRRHGAPVDEPDLRATLSAEVVQRDPAAFAQRQPSVTTHLQTRVTEVTQTADTVTVTAEGDDGQATSFTADYLVACDGARSNIRRDWASTPSSPRCGAPPPKPSSAARRSKPFPWHKPWAGSPWSNPRGCRSPCFPSTASTSTASP
ncbi:hypothetical protein FXW78_21555 [Rhodococcus opacus]|nr:hypothetical protein [Rhodococcus opacus]